MPPHVADAANVPAVMLLASLPPSRFPYYPHVRIVTPSGMEALPGWGTTKVVDADWSGMREDYARAWRDVSAARRATWNSTGSRRSARESHLTMRAALLLGLPCAARNIGRARRFCRGLLDRAGHEAGRGNVVTAAVLVVLYAVGL